MLHTSRIAGKMTSLLAVMVCAMMVSACSPNKTEVAGWWVNQQWDGGSSGGGDE